MNAIWIIIIFLCATVSFLMSGMEAGIFKLNRLRLRNLERSGDKRAKLLLEYLDRPEQFLWTILIGNILANFVILCATAFFLNKYFEASKMLFWIIYFITIFIFYLVCDLMPKILFRSYANSLCLSMLYPFRVLYLCLSPAVWIITKTACLIMQWTGGRAYTGKIFASREEIRYFMRDAKGGLTGEEISMIERVLDLQSLTVRHLTIPLIKVSTVSLHTSVNETLSVFKGKGFSHLPVMQTQDNKITVAGIVSLTDILYRENNNNDMKVAYFVKPAIFFNENTKLEEALTKFQKSGRKIAIVLGLDKSEIGIISLNDILAFVFGEINL